MTTFDIYIPLNFQKRHLGTNFDWSFCDQVGVLTCKLPLIVIVMKVV